MQARTIESVYPALDLISRLSSDTTTFLADNSTNDFVPLTLQYLSCRIWKIRQAAAKALAAFISRGEDTGIWIDILLKWGFDKPGGSADVVHGGLCAVRVLLENSDLSNSNTL